MHSCETLPGDLWGPKTPPRMAGQHGEVASHDTCWGAKVLTGRGQRAAERRGLQGEGWFSLQGEKGREEEGTCRSPANDELGLGCAGK